MNDTLQSLHGTANDALVRLLFERVRDMRSGASDFGQAAEALPGRPLVSSDPKGEADAPADSGRSKGES